MNTTRSLSIALSLLLLGLLVPTAAVAQEGAAEGEAAKSWKEPVVTLLEPGAEPRVQLRFKPAEGATAETEMRMTMSMQGMQMPPTNMPLMRILFETNVDDVADNGDLSYSVTYTEAEARDEPGVNPMIRQQMNTALRSMRGMKVRAVVSDRGVTRESTLDLPEGTDPMMRQQMEGMSGSLDQFGAPVPEEAVGVGAKWKVESTLTQQGMKIQQTATYTLKSVEGDVIEMDVELKQNADPQDMDNPMMPPGASMRLLSYDGEGNGEMKLKLTEVMPSTGRLKLKNDIKMSMSMGGQTQEMNQEMEMDMNMSAVDPKKSPDENDRD